MADTDLLDALEEIDAACERAREMSDYLWKLAAHDRDAHVQITANDYAYELSMALRRVQDETTTLRIALAGCPVDESRPNVHPLELIDPAGGRT